MDEQIISLKEIVFWVAGILGILIFKFLAWFMPKTAALWFQKFRLLFVEDLIKDVKVLSAKVDILIVENTNYKNEKHKIQSELVECKDAIVTEDVEKLKALKEIYKEKLNRESDEKFMRPTSD